MCPNSIYFGLKSLCRYFGVKVYTVWVHGPFRVIAGVVILATSSCGRGVDQSDGGDIYARTVDGFRVQGLGYRV